MNRRRRVERAFMAMIMIGSNGYPRGQYCLNKPKLFLSALSCLETVLKQQEAFTSRIISPFDFR